MNIVPSEQIITVLSAFSDSNVPYRLLRNINNELPDNLKFGKDIDILVRWNEMGRTERFLKQTGFHRVPHPLRGDQFLYGVHPFRFYRHNSLHFFVDCHFELACRSLNQGEWIPLDRRIQKHAWEHSAPHHIGTVILAGLSRVCECLHLLTRCVFDKRKFEAGYIRRIEELTEVLSDTELLAVIQPVFFKFSVPLVKLIRAKCYEKIIPAHLSFTEY